MPLLWIPVVVALSLGLAGCKHAPSYIGTYGLVVTDTMKAGMAKIPKENLGKAQKYLDAAAKMTATIRADGTYTITNPATGKVGKGTYSADRNELALSPIDPAVPGAKPDVATFNDADQTLTIDSGPAGPLVLKRK